MFHSSHLAVAKGILSSYRADKPFHSFLKLYFKEHKKHGSKDRRSIASICYNYFRLGKSFPVAGVEERIFIAAFLCETKQSELLQIYKPEWNDMINTSVENKISVLELQFLVKNIFPFQDQLSNEIDAEKFSLSFLEQPDLFMRVRNGLLKVVIEKLAANNISCEVLKEDSIALPNSTNIDTIVDLDREAVVQDYNSQRVGELFKLPLDNSLGQIDVWDCCSGSGGKSIMAYDFNPSIRLTVSDKREAILQNLHQRFEKAGIKNHTSFHADLTKTNKQFTDQKFDFIISDVPCTGSGTWARTPEQLCYFNENEIKKYSDLQKQISENVIIYLKPGGYFLYITCSVFKKENEEAVDFIKQKFNLNLVKMQLFKGYEMKADTMFAALFKKKI